MAFSPALALSADTPRPGRTGTTEAPRSAFARAIEDATGTATVGPGSTGPQVVRAQILLDRARFSPGEIDGAYGNDLAVAINAYQDAHGLSTTGSIHPEMWKLLAADQRPLLTTYTVTVLDLKGPFEPVPKEAHEQAQMKWMGYESPEEELGERFHLSPKLLAEINPHLDLKAGERIVVPNVRRAPAAPAVRVVVSKSKRTVTAYGSGDRVLAVYPATLGGPHDPLPIGNWTITSVVHNPWFDWNPEHFWNVDPKVSPEKLPPGPNNPVGTVWMGTSKEHYGIHGSPDPGQVRHGESYGCIRLTNWDAEDLSHMVRRGTPVDMVE